MKTKNHIVLFLSLMQFRVFGADVISAEQVNCGHSESSLNVLAVEPVIEDLKLRVMKSACDDKLIYKNITDRVGGFNHTDEICSQIKLCSDGSVGPDTTRDALELLKIYMPKAALLGILTKEINDKKSIQQKIKAYELATKEKICPAEVVEADCEKSIRNSLIDISGSKVLANAPLSSESISSFISKNFFSLAKQTRKEKSTRSEIKALCKSTINYNQICEKQAERVIDILSCENNSKSVNCLNQEQMALGILVSKHLGQKGLFYAMENELCSSVRVVQAQPVQSSVFNISDNRPSTGLRMDTHRVGLRRDAPPPGLRLPEASGGRSPVYLTEVELDVSGSHSHLPEGHKPDATSVKPIGDLQSTLSSTPLAHTEEVKKIDSRDTPTLSESVSHSLQESVGEEAKVIVNNSIATTAGASGDFAGRFSTITEEERLKKEAIAQKKLEDEGSLGSADKKKQAELEALNTQISSLKSKLEDMGQRVEDLKAKKEANPAITEEVDKESLEREKNITELKKKVLELEADKKRKEEDARVLATKESEELARSIAESIKHQVAITTAAPKADNVAREMGREREKVANNYGTISNYSDVSRAPANLGSAASSQAVGSTLVLKQAGTLATSDSFVVYMTASELQKYPLHLRDSASAGEIETMLKGNAGSSVILGDNEQIIPILENGVVALDENGNIKFKRVKISLVKNDNEKKQNIAREISSVGDLKLEEKKKRDLIRYQEMKKALQVK